MKMMFKFTACLFFLTIFSLKIYAFNAPNESGLSVGDNLTYNDTRLDIICWGDSLTAGAGSSSGNSYPKRLAQMTGLTVFNSGVGGESSNTIAARSGAIPFLIKIAGRVKTKEIPMSGPVEIEFSKTKGHIVSPLRRGNGGSYKPQNLTLPNGITNRNAGLTGYLNGVRGYIYFTGSSREPGEYFFVREKPGNAVYMGSEVYTFHTEYSEKHRNDIAIIWIGQNGNSHDQVLLQVQSMIDHLNEVDKKYLVIPKPTSTDEEDLDFIKLWGERVIPIRRILTTPIYDPSETKIISSYGLSQAGLTPTEQDLVDVSLGQVPKSLRVDNVHFNDYGYEILANVVYRRLVDLEYIAEK